MILCERQVVLTTKRRIIKELFSESPAMAAHLSGNGNCSTHDLLNAICGATIALQRKLELLRECSTWDLGISNEELDQNEECRERIDAIEQALSQLESKPGDVFLWRNCWYDRDWQDNVGDSGFKPCLSIFDVFAAIDAFIAFEAEGLDEEDTVEELTGDIGWYEVSKWEQQIGEDGQPHLIKTPWEYIIVDRQLCYFSRKLSDEERHDQMKCWLSEVCSGSSDLNLSIPFKCGDIITVDCGKFAPTHHAVLLNVGRDCCGVQIAYVDDNKKLQTAALKHSHCFTDNYLSKVSPLYRLSLYEGELGENEKKLKEIQDDIMQCKEEGRKAYCRGLWNAIHYFNECKQ